MPSDPMQFLALLAPLGMIFAAWKMKGVARVYIEAGAISPETARRPEGLKIPRGPGQLTRGVRRGVLIPLGDGRFYADVRVYRRRRVWTIFGVAALGVAMGGLVWFLRR